MHSCTFDVKDAKPFNEGINQLNLVELSLTNAKFTWIGQDKKKSRIDSAFINDIWANSRQWTLKALPRKNFDHRALLASMSDFN